MTYLSRSGVVALALLGLAGGLAAVPREIREVSLVAPLETLPRLLDDWRPVDREVPQVLPRDPAAPVQFTRAYSDGADLVWVTVSYYPSQVRQRPASLELLYPSQGWSELTARAMILPVNGGGGRSIPATLVVMRRPDRFLTMLYWYQVGARSVASDHWNRALLLYNRLVHRRDDGALVRVASPAPETRDVESVVSKQAQFVRVFYPELLRRLPH